MPGRLRLRLAAATVSLATLLGGCSVFDSSQVHTISLEVEEAALATMLETFVDTGDKEWVRATVTIDGQVFRDVGNKLKGNSSLRAVTIDSAPEDLPWPIRLDKYVDGQNLDGYTDVTVRSSSSETALNEAVALDLLGEAGLVSEEAVATRFAVNGSAAVLRLTVQNLDDTWVQQSFPDAGADSVLYKADADGHWSWRGEDGDYASSFEIEAGEETYAPLIKLLDLVNNGTADEIAERLPTLVDLDAFADYLAFQKIVDNVDDIDGPGNNSYLFWDSATGMFTVVVWDHNLAFGSSPGGGDPRAGGPAGGDEPGAGPQPARPSDGQRPGGGGMTREHPLVQAFTANPEWVALLEQAKADLQGELIDSGELTASVEEWTGVLTDGATDLVPVETISAEAEKISAYAD